jgi:hypothetical protein
LYDANVLYPAPLRDMLMWLAMTPLFSARWSDHIHDEWIRNVLADRPDLSATQLGRTRDMMNRAVPGCLVSGYEGLVPALALPDMDDRHILAAAIHTGAGLIVTFNLKDFPSEALRTHGIEAVHPDEFIMRLIALDAAAVCGAVQRQRAMLKSPPISVEEFLAAPVFSLLPRTVEFLRGAAGRI